MHINPEIFFSAVEQDFYKEVDGPSEFDLLNQAMQELVTTLRSYESLDKQYMLRSPERYPFVREQVKVRYFSAIYKMLSRIDVKSIQFNEITSEQRFSKESYTSLTALRVFFEQLEHYEKCAVIVKIEKLIYPLI